MDRSDIVVTQASAGLPQSRELIAELDDYLNSLYPPERNYLLDIDELMQPSVTFLLASHAGTTVGCGALRQIDADSAELKRMWVRPAARGLGIGRALLTALEDSARNRGLGYLLLETGISQPEALSLYERHGFVQRSRFGDYRDDPLSLFYEKRL